MTILIMTETILQKYKTITYDEKGKPVTVSLNLKNKLMKKAYEKVMEEIEDALDVKEAMNRLEDGQGRPFDEFVAEYLKK
jgi:hypothetical protein